VLGAVRFPDDGRIDPPLYLRALRIAAEKAGARFQSGALVRRVITEPSGSTRRARGVALEDGVAIDAGHVVVAAGSWSSLVEGTDVPVGAVRPARGQIVELSLPVPVLGGVVFGPRCYLSPRDDGRVLVGSTLEFVGFRRGVTARAVRDLLAAAIELVPALGEAQVERSWSSFRPYTDDEHPLLGPTEIAGLHLATGHHRNGILLSAVTGAVVAAGISGEPLPTDIEVFSIARLRAPHAVR
jgi:glycine oxidase